MGQLSEEEARQLLREAGAAVPASPDYRGQRQFGGWVFSRAVGDNLIGEYPWVVADTGGVGVVSLGVEASTVLRELNNR